MDYNLTKTVEGKIEYNTGQAMPYGDMPPSMLVAKFEETDMGPDEEAYNNYARTTLCNWGPDTNKFESENARGGVNRRSGRIQLQYYGHRGDADDPYRPEIFDGFIGPEDRDPRGICVDPDMKEFTKQQQSRMRFVGWTPDGSEQITGGGRSEGKLMADQQTLFKIVRDRLKVFDRQLDGRKEGIRRGYEHKSSVPKQILVQSYGDYIKDYALNPQRRANIISEQIVRDSRAWREETADADFAFARYTQLCRRARSRSNHNPVTSARQDSQFSDADTSKCFKAAALLMANIARGKTQCAFMMKNGDMDMSEARVTLARKTEPFIRDLALILRSMTADGRFATSDITMTGKTASPSIAQHLARQVVYNHLLPAHHQLNAEIIYKSVKPGADTRKIKNSVITDANNPQIRDINTIGGKTAPLKSVIGAKLHTSADTDKTESTKTFNYKLALNPNGDKRLKLTSTDTLAQESDQSQSRRPGQSKHRATSTKDVEDNMRYGDNTCKERHARGLGSKYMNRFIDRDSRGNEISANN